MSFRFLHRSLWFPSDMQESIIDLQGGRVRTKALPYPMETDISGVPGSPHTPLSTHADAQSHIHTHTSVLHSMRNSWGNYGLKSPNKWQVIFSWEWSVQAINHFGDHPCRFQSSLASSRLMTSIDRDEILWQVCIVDMQWWQINWFSLGGGLPLFCLWKHHGQVGEMVEKYLYWSWEFHFSNIVTGSFDWLI